MLEDPRVKAHDFAFLATATGGHPDEVAGEITLVLEDGNQALTFGVEAFRRAMASVPAGASVPVYIRRRGEGRGAYVVLKAPEARR